MPTGNQTTHSASGTACGQSCGVFRAATEADFPRITAIWTEAFPEDTADDVADYLGRFFVPGRIRVYERDGEVAAMLSVFTVIYDGSPAAYIYALATDRRFRGCGIARDMLNRVQDERRCPLIVHPKPNGVAAFYRDNGFSLLPEAHLRAMAKENGIEELLLDSGDGYIRPSTPQA